MITLWNVSIYIILIYIAKHIPSTTKYGLYYYTKESNTEDLEYITYQTMAHLICVSDIQCNPMYQ